MKIVAYEVYYSEVLAEDAKKSGGSEKKLSLEFRISDSAFKIMHLRSTDNLGDKPP